MFNLIHPVGADEGSGTFMLFVMLLVVAVSSMLASSLPIAVLRRDRPGHRGDRARTSRCRATLRNYILALMAVDGAGLLRRAGLPALFDDAGHASRRAPKRTR